MSSGLVLAIAIGLLVIMRSRGAQQWAGMALFVIILIACKDVFMYRKSCPRDGTECFAFLQPAWSGFCWASDRAGILKIDQSFYLSASAGADATATCIDVRRALSGP